MKKNYALSIVCLVFIGAGHTLRAMDPMRTRAAVELRKYTDWFNAAAVGNVAAIKKYVTAGVPVDVRDEYGRTALLMAAQWRKKDAIACLVSCGADINAYPVDSLHREDETMTALIKACRYDDADMAKFLLACGAKVNARGGSGELALHVVLTGMSPMHMGIYNPYVCWADSDLLAMIHLLLEHGAEINARDGIGDTPIMRAATNSNAMVVKYLVERGANLNERDRRGDTPLALAKKRLADICHEHASYVPGFVDWQEDHERSCIFHEGRMRKIIDYLAPFEERRCILAVLLASEELGCAKDKDFPPELMAKRWPLAEIMKSVVCRDGK